MSTEAWRASDAIQIMVFSIVSDAGAVVVFGFLLFLVNWKLFLVITVVVIAIRGLQNLIVERVKSLGQRVTVANRTLGDRMIVLSVDLIRVVRVFGQEKREELRFIERIEGRPQLLLPGLSRPGHAGAGAGGSPCGAFPGHPPGRPRVRNGSARPDHLPCAALPDAAISPLTRSGAVPDHINPGLDPGGRMAA